MTRTVLVIDTATPAVTAAVVSVGDTITELAVGITVDPRAHAETLTPNVLAAVADSGLAMSELDAVVVGTGPGPFTGLRVGMASAAAYGHALDIPVFGVCSLDGIGGRTSGGTLVVSDARRREVYWARYQDGVRIDAPGVSAPVDVSVDGMTAVAGSAAHAALFDLPLLGPNFPEAPGLVAAVADWDIEPPPLVPLYLRRPDALSLAERGVTR
ncbi:MAG: hypothetical protein K0R68_1058 [Mycobacterium sp.]|jgi:tRNA threonylcarbamoyl adenosine modification protein YeaZ|nr:hypothetical protein [Mycobacterium sp.]